MRIKELNHWLDAFGLPQSPWATEPADWATALNMLARMLHPTLAKRVEGGIRKEREEASEKEEEDEEDDEEGRKKVKDNKDVGGEDEEEREQKQKLIDRRRTSSQIHPSTQLPFQETMELAERVLGLPQFVVVADLKRGSAENQLALFVSICALHFALGPADTKSYRDFQFAFRIYFDMDSDRIKRECAGCGKIVHLIERLVLNGGQVWHRSCLKCGICGRQLYRGAFHFLESHSRMECVDHRANAILFGDPKQRFALPITSSSIPPPSMSQSLSLNSNSNPQMDKRALMASSVSIPSQNSPPPRPPPPKIGNDIKMCHQSMLFSPKAENSKEEEAEDEETIEKKIASAASALHDVPIPRPRTSLLKEKAPPVVVAEKTSCWEVLEYPEELNPFGSDEEEEIEEEKEEEEGKRGKKEEKERTNPFESDSDEEAAENGRNKSAEEGGEVPTKICSTISTAAPQMVKLLSAPCQSADNVKEVTVSNIYPKIIPALDCQQIEDYCQPLKYLAPLGSMPFRVGLVEKHSQPTSTSGGNLADQQQQLMHELDTKLRRLHSQLDQWEITGARIEGQILRELGQSEEMVWRKGNKLTNEFGQLVEQRCAALAMEGLLVRSYMDAFLGLAHAELDRQMKEEIGGNGGKMRQFNDLLAELLHIRNELTDLDSREKEARLAAQAGAIDKKKMDGKKEAKRAEKEKKEKERMQQQKEIKAEKEEEMAKEKKGGGRLLKNTFKNLKKKL